MSKKDKAVGAEAHMNSVARVSDGWVYDVTLQNGATLEFWDRDYLGAVVARWNSTEPNALIHFSGAKADAEGFVIGAGAVRASYVVAIAEANPDSGDEDEEVAARREEFRPVGTSAPATPAAPGGAGAGVTVSDDDLDGEVKS